MGTIHIHNACHETGDINNPVNAIAVTPILSSPFLAENQITAMAIHTMTALATSQGMMAVVSECRIRASIPRNNSLSSAAATRALCPRSGFAQTVRGRSLALVFG